MKTITFKGGKIVKQLPESWTELNNQQHQKLIELIAKVYTEEIDLYDARMMFLVHILSYEPSKFITNEKREQVNATLHELSKKVNFFYTWGEDGYEFTQPKVPRLACKLDISGRISIVPQAFFANITCEQFADAFEFYQAYTKTQDIQYLRKLTAVLYMSKPYNSKYALHAENRIMEMAPWCSIQSFLYFQHTMQYISQHPRYSILFAKGEEKKGKLKLGMASTIYTLMDRFKIGLNEARTYLFPEYLEMQLKIRVDDIRQLKASGLKPHEIVKQAGITIQQLNTII